MQKYHYAILGAIVIVAITILLNSETYAQEEPTGQYPISCKNFSFSERYSGGTRSNSGSCDLICDSSYALKGLTGTDTMTYTDYNSATCTGKSPTTPNQYGKVYQSFTCNAMCFNPE